MRIDLEGYLEKDLEVIQKAIEKEKKGVRLSPSDAARYAISKTADEIRNIKPKG